MTIFRRRRVAVLTNPRSGKNTKRAGLAKALGSFLTSPRWVYAPETLQQLDRDAATIRRERHDVVAIIGGDGTASQALTRLIIEHEAHADQPMPQVIIVPTGSMNNLATTLGQTRWPADVFVRRIVEKLASGAPFDTAHLAMLRCGDAFGTTFGAGFPVSFLEKYYADGAGGPPGALRTVLQVLLNDALVALPFVKRQRLINPLSSEVTMIDGDQRVTSPYGEHTLIMAGSIETIGLNCAALPQARRDHGKFMLRASSLSVWGLAACIGPLWIGAPLPMTFEGTTARAELRFDTPTRTMLDGDFQPATRELALSMGPTLTFITG